MAGAAKRRNKVERQTEQAATHMIEKNSNPESQLPGGLDGTSDDRSTSDRPAHGFGPSLGYDPARGNMVFKPEVPRRLELPAEAYRDLNHVSSIQPDLTTLYKVIPKLLAHSLPPGLLAWLAKPTPLHYPAPTLSCIYTHPSLFDLLSPPSFLHNTQLPIKPYPLILTRHKIPSTVYSQYQSRKQAILPISSCQTYVLPAHLQLSSHIQS